MEIAAHIDALRREGGLLAEAAERAGLGAAVPPCPPWLVKDLLRHIGYIHRWAGRRFRVRWIATGDGVGADVHDDLVHLGVIRGGDLPGQERLGDHHQRVGQAGGGVHGLLGAASGRLRGDVFFGMGVLQVADGCAQRLQQRRALERGQPERARQGPVVLEPPGQPPPDPGRGVVSLADLPVRAGEPL